MPPKLVPLPKLDRIPLLEIRQSLRAHIASLSAEFDLLQKKVDQSTQFRLQILGWTTTAVFAAPVYLLARSSKEPVDGAEPGIQVKVLIFSLVSYLLLYLHKVSADKMVSALVFGERAKEVEREIQLCRQCLIELSENKFSHEFPPSTFRKVAGLLRKETPKLARLWRPIFTLQTFLVNVILSVPFPEQRGRKIVANLRSFRWVPLAQITAFGVVLFFG